MSAYYNENDPKAAAWLRELIKGGHIAAGDVDERSIEDVVPGELAGYSQCHFFAGIGGWSYALRLAGWPDDRSVWTGSCPCQPFSQAGKGAGFADERHLWPAWHWLIRECRPERIFGEQVANNLAWLDLISRDLENEDYAVGAAIVGAHSVGAPHVRQRLYWVAHADGRDASAERLQRGRQYGQQSQDGGIAGELGDACGSRSRGDAGAVSGAEGSTERKVWREPDESQPASELGDSNRSGPQRRGERRNGADQRSPWEASLVNCRDGKRRPIEPGSFPLAHGIPGRVGLLRGYGNAIVPQVAAAFIEATGLVE